MCLIKLDRVLWFQHYLRFFESLEQWLAISSKSLYHVTPRAISRTQVFSSSWVPQSCIKNGLYLINDILMAKRPTPHQLGVCIYCFSSCNMPSLLWNTVASTKFMPFPEGQVVLPRLSYLSIIFVSFTRPKVLGYSLWLIGTHHGILSFILGSERNKITLPEINLYGLAWNSFHYLLKRSHYVAMVSQFKVWILKSG